MCNISFINLSWLSKARKSRFAQSIPSENLPPPTAGTQKNSTDEHVCRAGIESQM